MKGKNKKIINIAIIFVIAISFVTTGIKATSAIAANMITYKDTTVEAKLDELINKTVETVAPVTCPPGHRCTTSTSCPDGALCSKVAVGDYIKMTPESTNCTIFAGSTGYSDDQTINPSELNLWRVISINSDGTIDMVSQYVSSKNVYFYGLNGYLNFVGTLNLIAKQYENHKYTVGSRHMGYGGQTQVITDTSMFVNPALVTTSTPGSGDSQYESIGGGDILYKTDESLVKTATGGIRGFNIKNVTSNYWVASRYYGFSNAYYYYWIVRFGSVDDYIANNTLYEYRSNWNHKTLGYAIRPIVTLRADVTTSNGNGSSGSPWELQ